MMAAINLLTVFEVLLAIPVFGVALYFAAFLVLAPFATVFALLKGESPEEAATIAFCELAVVLVWAGFHFHIVKL